MWRTYCRLTSFFPIVDACLSCVDMTRQSCRKEKFVSDDSSLTVSVLVIDFSVCLFSCRHRRMSRRQ